MRIEKKIIILLFIAEALIIRQLFSQKFYVASRLTFNTSVYDEFAPVLFNDNLVFISDRKNDWLKTTTDIQGNSLTDIYIVKQSKPGKFGNVQEFSKNIATRFYEGPVSFSKDHKTIYFTRSIVIDKKFNSLDNDTTYGIFSAEFIDNNWVNITEFQYNNTGYNVGFPYLTEDGKKLYFCSQSPEGKGGFDIYVCEWENNFWGAPKNLGDKINTPENEVFPFIHNSGRLYFASRGHNSKGGLDLFYSDMIEGKWQEPINLPEPFNSRFDDFSLIINESLDTAYMSSNRSGTMDIFMVYSTLPVFTNCPLQQENDYCFVFYDEGVIDLDTTTFTYEWDLGDGTKIRAKEAEHCYANPGNYTISLNVIDTLTGEISYNEASYDFRVEEIEQVYITAIDTARVNQGITLNGFESHLKNFEIDKYYWEFGDGLKMVNPEVKHSYSRSGVYDIQLGVTSVPVDQKTPPLRRCVKRPIVIIK